MRSKRIFSKQAQVVWMLTKHCWMLKNDLLALGKLNQSQKDYLNRWLKHGIHHVRRHSKKIKAT